MMKRWTASPTAGAILARMTCRGKLWCCENLEKVSCCEGSFFIFLSCFAARVKAEDPPRRHHERIDGRCPAGLLGVAQRHQSLGASLSLVLPPGAGRPSSLSVRLVRRGGRHSGASCAESARARKRLWRIRFCRPKAPAPGHRRRNARGRAGVALPVGSQYRGSGGSRGTVWAARVPRRPGSPPSTGGCHGDASAGS